MIIRALVSVLALTLVVGCGKKDDKTAKSESAKTGEKADKKADEAADEEEGSDEEGEDGADEAPTKEEPKAEEPKAEEPKAEEPPKVELVELAVKFDDGTEATIVAPKGAKAEDSYGTLEIKAGDGAGFALQIDLDDSMDWGKVKAFYETNDVQKLQKFHTDTADTILAETKAFGKTSYFLDHKTKVGDKDAHCKSYRGAHSFTQAQAAALLTACKSLKAK